MATGSSSVNQYRSVKSYERQNIIPLSHIVVEWVTYVWDFERCSQM